jgi:hypothetical protein
VPPYRVEDIVVTRCPMIQVSGIEQDYMQAYLEYKNGFLPNDGGWLNQPMKFSQVMIVMDKIMGKLEKKNG